MATENAIARFLFAILKQKDLKDIDWHKVAHDPVLLQPISNAHAARMRYSRFRNSIVGHEPQRRSRAAPTNPKPSRVVKRKKGDKAVKSEEEDDGHADLLNLDSSPVLKQEMFITPSGSAVIRSNNPSFRAHDRLLTPCSDSETALTTPQAYSPSPAPEIRTASATYGFAAGTGTATAHESVHHPWQPTYAGFPDLTNLNDFTAAFNHAGQHTTEGLSLHPSMLEHNQGQGHGSMIKREEWDTGNVDNQHYQQDGHC